MADPDGWAGVTTRLGVIKGQWWEKAIGFFMPHAGTTINSIRIDQLSQVLEYLGNVTMAYYTELTDMLVSMRAMVMQNRVALDMLLAEKGGVCGMIDGECCVWIPDPRNITNRAVARIKKVVEALTSDRVEREEGYAWWQSIFSGWGGWLLHLIGSALLIIVVIIFGVFLIKLLLTICLKKCCAASPLTQAIIIINSERSDEDDSTSNGEGDNQGRQMAPQLDILHVDLGQGLQPFLFVKTDD